MEKIFVGKGDQEAYLLANKANQHGLIAGATGTGKTVSLKVLAENFSAMGVPCILSDVKGDLSNLSQVGQSNENLQSRIDELGLEGFSFDSYPVNLWDVYGQEGMALRVTISEMGPILLSRIMDLNETQLAVLNAAFRVADESGLLLIDIKDLRSLLNALLDNRDQYAKLYGSIAPQTVHAILRKLLLLEDMGGNDFFGEPAIDISDLIARDSSGRGLINILSAGKLIQNPAAYSMFLLYLLNELFEILPEVGNPDKPVLVFFFDEAHLLFDSAPKHLEEKIQQLVRLIRSKGVGIFFVTQNPLDIPSGVAGQLANRIIHGLRAFSPKDKKNIDGIIETFRPNPDLDSKEAILNLRTGEAIVSFLEDSGNPSMAQRVLVSPPRSSFKALDKDQIQGLIQTNPLHRKYQEAIDRESAYEVLEKSIALRQREEDLGKREEALAKEAKKSQRAPSNDLLGKSLNSFLGTLSRSIGREIARNLMGSLKRRK